MQVKCVSLSMKLAAIAALAVSAANAQQQTTPAQSSLPSNTQVASQIPSGTTICVVLAKTIDARNAKPGDAITARVTLPVLAKGQVVLGDDSKIEGHVISARKHSDGERSELAIVFDHAVLKDGGQVPLVLTVQAIGRPALTAAELADLDLSSPETPPAGGISGQTSSSSSTGRQTTMSTPARAREAPQPGPPSVDEPEREHPALDTGSYGAVGLPNLTLTESTSPGSGSLVRAKKKDVKLDGGMEMVLRVVAAPGERPDKKS